MRFYLQFYYYYYFLLSFMINKTMSKCVQESYLNRCNVNIPDSANDSSEPICNCNEAVYCSIIELPVQCTSTLATLKNIGSDVPLDELRCIAAPVKSKFKFSAFAVEISSTSKEEVLVNITAVYSGTYKITCNRHNSRSQCEAVKVISRKLFIDKEVELELLVNKNNSCGSNNIWCFIKSPDNVTDILPGSLVTKSRIKCSHYAPTILGVFNVWVGDIRRSDSYTNKISFEVCGRAPTAHRAEYSPDLQTIFVHFDQNIEMSSECEKIFSKESQDHFGKGFTCTTTGNILKIKMGVDFTIMSHLEIAAGNGLHRAGSEGVLFASPVSIPVSEKRILSPNLSLYVSSSGCGVDPSQKYMNIEVVPLKSQNIDDTHKPSIAKTRGKTHRENLIVWRKIRQFQHRLSYKVMSFHNNASDLLHSFENLEKLETFVEGEEHSRLGIESTGAVSVVIKSPPAPSMIVAEVNVTFCQETGALFKYKWSVNEEAVPEDGRLLIVKNLPPGKYVVACLVVEHNSTEILGQGWTTTEIIDQPEQLVIYPAEMVVGKMEGFSLQIITWKEDGVYWTCRTDSNHLCHTADQRLVNEVVNLNSGFMYVPPGTLMPGSYVWLVGSAEEQATAKVIIKPNNVPVIDVEMHSVIVNSTQKVVINSTVKRLEPDCRIGWSSVRQKGSDYVNLQSVAAYTEIKITTQELERNVPLIIPPRDNNWKGLKPDSSYLFKLQVLCPDSASHIKVPILVNDPPIISPLKVEPGGGKAFITSFLIHRTEANDRIEDYPLLFTWSYVDPCGIETEIRRGAFPKSFTTYLPPGDLRVMLRVCDVMKSCSVVSSSVITVQQFGSIPPGNFKKALHEIQKLLASGDSLEAFGLAIIVFRSLALTAETEIRESAYEIISQAILLKIKDLSDELETDPRHMKRCLEFFEQAQTVVKYFRKSSSIIKDLMNFKNNISTKSKFEKN